MEIGRQIFRQSILSWKIVKMLVRKGATYLSITALTEKNVRIVTAQQNAVFLMTDISSCLQISTTIPLTDRDLMIIFFWNHQVPPNLSSFSTSDDKGPRIPLASCIL